MSLAPSLSFNWSTAQKDNEMPIWIPWLFVFTIFSREIGYATIGGIDYDLISYNFFILYLLFQIRHLYINSQLIFGIFLILIAGLSSKIYLGLEFAPLWKQIIPISILYFCSYDFFTRVNFKFLFSLYFKISYLTAIIGIIQILLKITFGIKFLTDYSAIFVDSIAAEPSHYAVIILPAVIYGIFYIRIYRVRTAILLIALLLTTSSTAYIVLLIMMLIIYRRIQYIVIILPVLYFIFNKFLLGYDKFNIRLAGFGSYLENKNFNKIYAATSVSFLSNAEVAISAVKQNPLFGCGLGGHEEVYKRYFGESAFRFSYLYGINAASAHSLLIRIISETGLSGLFVYLWSLVKSLLLRADDYHRIISIACLSHFVGKALKLGGYFDYGTPFFAMMLLFNYFDYKSMSRKKQAISPGNVR